MSSTPEGLDQEAWTQWLVYRQSGKHKISEKSIPLAQKMLAKFGKDQKRVVDHSIANGWRGLFAPEEVKAAAARQENVKSGDRLTEILQEFADLTGRPLLPATIDAMHKALVGMRPDELERARQGLIKTWVYPRIPMPADFWRAARSYGWL